MGNVNGMFIGGEWVPGATGETEPIVNPATGETLVEVAVGSSEDVDRAVKAARDAFGDWMDSTPGERAGMLLKLADRLEENKQYLSDLESANVGKPAQYVGLDLDFSIDNLRFFAGAARTLEGRAAGEYMRGYTSMLRREPVGVVASIAPWNYPIMMAVWKIGPALAAGNTVVLKPSEQTPLTALRLAHFAADIFPPGVFNVITGHGEQVGAPLARHPGVDMVSVTGDVATGKEVARAAADSLKRVHLELGGKAPVIVFDDADLEAVAAGVKLAGYFNTGQDCTAAARVLAMDDVYESLLGELVPAVDSLVVGDPRAEQTEVGPLVSGDQRARVTGFVDRAVGKGAKVLTGGEQLDGKGFFYKPSIVVDVDQKDEIVQKEVFGPVVTVQRFMDDAQAIAWANDVPYGLSASVWTTNVSRALNAARLLRFGTVWINDHIPLVSEMPHGGYTGSGYGKDMSVYALEDYTNIKHVMAKL